MSQRDIAFRATPIAARLFRHSDAVLDACLRLAGRERVIANGKLMETGKKLRELLALIEHVAGDTK